MKNNYKVIKKAFLTVVFTVIFCGIGFGQTNLSDGDLALIGMDTPSEDFAFVCFVDIEASTEIYFTDEEAVGTYLIGGGEGTVLYTAPTGGITKGSVITYKGNSTEFSITSDGDITLANDGDGLIAYQGTSVGNVTTFLHAIGKNNSLIGTFPGGFSNYMIFNSDDGEYNGLRSGEASTLMSSINNSSNWVTSGSGVIPFNTNSFTISSVVNPTSFTSTSISTNQIDISWTQNSNSDDVMIVYNTTGTFTNPSNETSYSVSSSACNGTVIYNQSGTTFNHTSLSPGTQYFYKAWSVDANTNYSTGVTTDATTSSLGFANVIISEIVDHNTYQREYIELWNIGTASISIDGWLIKERFDANNTSERSITLNSSTQVNTGGNNYLTLDANEYCIIARDANSLKSNYNIDNDIAIFQGSVPQMNGNERYQLEDGVSKAIIDNFGDWDDYSVLSTSGSHSYYRLDDENGELSSNWDNMAQSSYYATPGYINQTSDGTVLPIKLTHFTAENNSAFNLIKWTTASEINNAYFTLEKSYNVSDFFEIAEVKGAGNSISELNYQFHDFETSDKTVYYRLKQTDFDGSSSYSEIISIDNKKKDNFSILNSFVADNQININIKSFQQQSINLNITNLNGQIIYSKEFKISNGINNLKIDKTKFKNSVYLITIKNQAYLESEKIVLF